MIKLARPRGGVGGSYSSFVEKRLSSKKKGYRIDHQLYNTTTLYANQRNCCFYFIIVIVVVRRQSAQRAPAAEIYIYICFPLLIVIVIGWFLYYCRFVNVCHYYYIIILWIMIVIIIILSGTHFGVVRLLYFYKRITAIYLLYLLEPAQNSFLFLSTYYI